MLYQRSVVQDYLSENMNNDEDDCCGSCCPIVDNVSTKNGNEPQLVQENQKLRIENENLKREKDDALTRLSEVMSVKLRDNNPNIADLSDPFRPTKLQEMFSELYDNEWTGAFAVLQDKLPERSAVEFLLDVYLLAYEFCSSELTKTWQCVCKWYIDEDTNTQLRKQLKDARKAKVSRLLKEINIEFLKYINKVCADEKIKEMLCGPIVNGYISKSVEIALLMCACDPPVVVACPGLEGRPVYLNNVTEIQEKLNIPEVSSVDTRNSQKVDVLVHSNNAQSSVLAIDVKDIQLEDIAQSNTTSAVKNPVVFVSNESKSGRPLDSETERHYIMNATSSIPTTSYGSMNNASVDSACLTSLNGSVTVNAMTSRNSRNMTAEKFGFGSPKMNPTVITKQPSKSVENAAFNRGLYRDYTVKGPRVEFFVWPVLYLHVDGPLLARGIAQGTTWGLTTGANSMWSWRTGVPEAIVSVANVEIRETEKVWAREIGTRVSETKVSTTNIEGIVLKANSSTGDIEPRLLDSKAPFNVDARGQAPEVSDGYIGDILPEATVNTYSRVAEADCPIQDSVSQTSEARVSVRDIEDHAEHTIDPHWVIKTQASDPDELPCDNEVTSTKL